jgi:hypothetical protein
MAGSTFGKRQKEMKRQEKRLEKSARRDQRKEQKGSAQEEELKVLDGPVVNFDYDLEDTTSR